MRKPLRAVRPANRLLNEITMNCGRVDRGMSLLQCYEDLGLYREAADLLEQVVYMDRKYRLPKLEENTKRLELLRARVAQEKSVTERMH